MDKWTRLNAELADARHYAEDMKQRAETAEAERDALRSELVDVLTIAVSRGDSLGYKLDGAWIERLQAKFPSIDFSLV